MECGALPPNMQTSEKILPLGQEASDGVLSIKFFSSGPKRFSITM